MDLTDREIETIAGHLKQADAPPFLYRYRRASEWALKEIREPHVHVASPEDMNDPFEYRASLRYDLDQLKEYAVRFFQDKIGVEEMKARAEADTIDERLIGLLMSRIDNLRKDFGLVCLSSCPRSNRMWGYYADSHRGVCITYDGLIPPFLFARSVTYDDPIAPLDAVAAHQEDVMRFGNHVSYRKGKEWEFEQEFRVSVGPFVNGRSRALPIRPEAIIEIRLGVKIGPDFRNDMIAAARELPKVPRIIQMGIDLERFRLTEEDVEV